VLIVKGDAQVDTLRLKDEKVKMIAHRGVSGLEAENTCAAFVAAGNRSYFGIETDVHRTWDGQFIIIHDDFTGRVANRDLPVEETNLSVLRGLSLLDRDGGEGRGDLVLPTLQEYIRICRRYEKAAVLELKNHFEPADIERIIALIRAEGHLAQTIFISFDLVNLICVRGLLPNQKAQYLIENRIPDDLLRILRRYSLDLDIDYHLLTDEWVRMLHAEGREVNVWTVNSLKDARRLSEWGVDYITSNIIE